jgi:NitT/TauT family transport system permease protein
MKRAAVWLPPLVGGAVILGFWYAIKAIWTIPSFILPAPHEILAAAWSERRALTAAALITGQGALGGFIAATALGFILSVAAAMSVALRRAIYPYVLVLQMTPVIILAPVLVIWLGQGLPAIVAVTFLICFFPIVANTTMGFASTDPHLRELFALCGATRRQEIRYLQVPAAMPYFLTGVKIAATLAPIGAITGDFLAGSSQNGVGGIGFMTVVYFSQLKTPALFATGLTACVLGFLFVGAVNVLHWLALRRWHESARDGDTAQ